jgi:hypothetical protein
MLLLTIIPYDKDMNIHKNKGQRKGLILIFKQKKKKDYVIKK